MATPPSSGGATAPVCNYRCNIMNTIRHLHEVILLCIQVRAPGDYRLTFRNPSECELSMGNCQVFVGVDTNAGDSNYLDIYLEGEADGWVAVGFSATPTMVRLNV